MIQSELSSFPSFKELGNSLFKELNSGNNLWLYQCWPFKNPDIIFKDYNNTAVREFYGLDSSSDSTKELRNRSYLDMDKEWPARKNTRASNRREVFTVFVNHLPLKLHWRWLSRIFRQHGKVIDVFIPRKRGKLGNRFGFVRFRSMKAAKSAIQKVNGRHILGCKLSVHLSQPVGANCAWRKKDTTSADISGIYVWRKKEPNGIGLSLKVKDQLMHMDKQQSNELTHQEKTIVISMHKQTIAAESLGFHTWRCTQSDFPMVDRKRKLLQEDLEHSHEPQRTRQRTYHVRELVDDTQVVSAVDLLSLARFPLTLSSLGLKGLPTGRVGFTTSLLNVSRGIKDKVTKLSQIRRDKATNQCVASRDDRIDQQVLLWSMVVDQVEVQNEAIDDNQVLRATAGVDALRVLKRKWVDDDDDVKCKERQVKRRLYSLLLVQPSIMWESLGLQELPNGNIAFATTKAFSSKTGSFGIMATEVEASRVGKDNVTTLSEIRRGKGSFKLETSQANASRVHKDNDIKLLEFRRETGTYDATFCTAMEGLRQADPNQPPESI